MFNANMTFCKPAYSVVNAHLSQLSLVNTKSETVVSNPAEPPGTSTHSPTFCPTEKMELSRRTPLTFSV